MTVEMDSTSDDHSPPLSDNAGSTWLNWENEISSISGLNLDSNSELNGLVEDKEVAARAVAFVVNSTRKGIVPLCADIANLLRAKRSLEKKVYLLKREVEALRSSTSVSFRTSHSTSTTPPLVEKSVAADVSGLQERSRPCSRCSQCSSTISNSPKLDSTYSFKYYLPSPSVSRDALRRTSPRLARQVPKLPVNGTQHFTGAQTSTLSDVGILPCSQASRHSCEHSRSEGRKNSLPEMTSEPSVEVQRINPKISKETQCYLPMRGDSPIEEQFIETVRLNSKLAEELGSARKEIEVLKGRLKELEMNQLAKECAQEHYRQDTETEEKKNNGSREECQVISPEPTNKFGNNHYTSVKINSLRVPVPPGSHYYAEPLYGCKCTACEEAMGGENSSSLNEDLQKFPINSKILVQLGDHVATKGEKTGRIRYIGHLDKLGQPNMVFVGLELDAPVGHHDGFFNKKRYFFCQRDHGIFLPLHDIICKIRPKASSCTDELGNDSRSSADDFLTGSVMTSKSTDDFRSAPTSNEDYRLSSKSANDFIALVGMTSSKWKKRQNCKNSEDNIILTHSEAVGMEDVRSAEDLV